MEVDTLLIGNRIRTRREELHMTREQLAELLDITPKFCSDIENGARGMSLKTLMRISKTLYMSTDYILFGKETEKDKTPFTIFAETITSQEASYYLRICREIKELSKIMDKDREDEN